MKQTSPLTALLAATALCAVTLPASAQTWDGDTDDQWLTDGNWSTGTAPNAIAASATWDGTGTLPATIEIGAAGATVGFFNFAATEDGRSVVIGGPGTITMDSANGSNNILNPNGATSTLTINNDINLVSGQSNVFNVNGQANLNGNISGSLGVRKTGAGALSLTGNNTYTGITRIDANILRIDTADALGSGAITYFGTSGSTKNLEVTTSTTINNDIVLNNTGSGVARVRADDNVTVELTTNNITSTGTNNTLQILNVGVNPRVNFTGDNLTTSIDLDLANAAETVGLGGSTGQQTWSGIVSGNGDVVKSGDSTVTLSGDNTNSGTTTVEGGTLLIEGNTSGQGAYTVEAGGTLGGSGAIATASEDVTVLGTLAPGSSIGTLTMDLGTGTLDISSAAGFEFELGATGDMIDLTTGTLDIGTDVLGFSDFTFLTEAGFAEGDYTLFDTDASIIGSLDLADLTGSVGGFIGTLSLINGGQDVSLNVAIPEPTSAAMLMGALGLLALRRRRS